MAIDAHECIYLMKDKLRYTFEALGFQVPSESEEDLFNTILLQPDLAVARAVAQSPHRIPPRNYSHGTPPRDNNHTPARNRASPSQPQPPYTPHTPERKKPPGVKREEECTVS